MAVEKVKSWVNYWVVLMALLSERGSVARLVDLKVSW